MFIYTAAPPSAPQTEDAFLLSFFGPTHRGYFADIGAHDGRSYSNTRPLWERGWSGILVEPDPETFKLLLANYPSKERLTFVNAAICSVDGTAQFTRHRDPSRSGWHSMSPEWIATWEPGAAEIVTVKAMRFSSLPLAAPLDFLSIDTEGMDYEIVRLLPASVRPALIACEVDKHLVRERLDGEMERRGYRFAWGSYLNSFYARDPA